MLRFTQNFLGYVCEELDIPSKSKLNIHCIQIFIIYRGSVKRIIHKHVNMMSELRHRYQRIFIFYVRRILNSS